MGFNLAWNTAQFIPLLVYSLFGCVQKLFSTFRLNSNPNKYFFSNQCHWIKFITKQHNNFDQFRNVLGWVGYRTSPGWTHNESKIPQLQAHDESIWVSPLVLSEFSCFKVFAVDHVRYECSKYGYFCLPPFVLISLLYLNSLLFIYYRLQYLFSSA